MKTFLTIYFLASTQDTDVSLNGTSEYEVIFFYMPHSITLVRKIKNLIRFVRPKKTDSLLLLAQPATGYGRLGDGYMRFMKM